LPHTRSQLGLGDRENRRFVKRLAALDGVLVASLAAAGNSSLVLSAASVVYACGDDARAQLGRREVDGGGRGK